MASSVEQIKEKLNIVDVVSGYIKLERAGGNFRARCPFHNERTPSFFVSPDRQSYHCFGCNRGGDMFSFVEEFEGLDFRGALKVLADSAGVTLDAMHNKGEDTEREHLFAVLEVATKFFERSLKSSDEAKTYLKSRGLLGETALKFRIGYAPDEWRALADTLAKAGFNLALAERAGLLISGPKGRYDRFRGRVMFPVSDSSGRVIGFSGRLLKEDKENAQAKYVNTPDTPLYDKSHVLYGFDKAKRAIRKEGTCVIVEGQMDLVMSHQAGVTHTVATSGTAISEHHVKLIKRMAEKVIFAFDPDDAGIAASQRGINIALAEGLEVKMATLPEGEDPADVVARNPKDWASAVSSAVHAVDFFLTALQRKGYDERKFRLAASETILPFIAQIPNSVERAHFVGKLAKALSVAEDPIWEELKKVLARKGTQGERSLGTAESVEDVEIVNRVAKITERLAGAILWQTRSPSPLIDVSDIRSQFEIIAGETGKRFLENPDGEREKELVFEAEVYYAGSEHLSVDIKELLVDLEQELLKNKFAKVMDALRVAEEAGDEKKTAELLLECQEISKKLGNIIKR